MMKQVAAILFFSSSLYALPTEPSINNIDSWVPVKYEKGDVKPLPPVSESWKDPNTEIFIGISHYRDSRCASTVNNIISKSKYPDRIKIGEF